MIRAFVCLAAALTAVPCAASPVEDARAIVNRSIAALGGEAALRNIRTLHLETIGHDFYIEQSERPEGPFIVGYTSTSEDRDVAGGRARIERSNRSMQTPDWSPPQTTIFDGATVAISAGGRFAPVTWRGDDTEERITLAPERLLFVALAAPDLAVAPDVTRQGVRQRVLTFGWQGQRARLLINGFDAIPTALELTRPDSFGIWGDVTETTYYSLWTLIAGGVRYPLQIDREWNGVTKASTTVVRVTANAPIDETAFAIPEDVRTAAATARANASKPAPRVDFARRRVEVADGVVQYAGSWNVEVVRQPDGLVVIEGPISSDYSAQVLDELSARYPGEQVKAVITTSDAWPHLGGLREYVARGIPVYALDLNRPIIERLLEADYGSSPDALARKPRAARATWVSSNTVIGSGETRVELYPARQVNGERMIFVYFPSRKLLYTSDEIQPMRSGGYFMPEYLQEVKDVIAREGLAVDRIFGMHAPPTPWSAIEAALAAAK
jgi:hypothetical protein